MPKKILENKQLQKNIIRGILLAVILFCFILGFIQHDYRDVMNKAIRICYECIGIG